MSRLAHKTQSGFSLIELLLAMALFSFGLLVIALGFMGLFGMYQSGIANRNTQANARVAIDRMVQTSRQAASFNDDQSIPNANVLCVGGSLNKKYYIDLADPNRPLVESDWDPSTVCNSTPSSPVPITSSSAQVVAFNVEQFNYDPVTHLATPCTNPTLCQLRSVRISLRLTNDYSKLDASNMNCRPDVALACAVTSLSTSVTARKPQ